MVYTVGGVQYTRRKKIPVTGAGSGAQTDYQIKLAAVWADAMQADFDDVIFTKADMQTLIDAWLESKVDSTSANIWVEFLTTPADGVEKIEAYMYFGNAGAANYWDIGATFVFGDDLESGNLNAWQQTTNGSVSGTAYSGSYSALNSKACCDTSYAQRMVSDNFGSIHDCVVDYWFRESDRQPIITLYEDSNNFVEFWVDIEPHSIMYTRFGVTEGGVQRGWTSNAGDFSQNTWYHSKIVVDGDNIKWYFDTSGATTLRGQMTLSQIENLDFVNFQFLTRGGNTYIDDLRIHKYAANPPTAAFGTEEHQRRTPMMM